MQAEWQLEARWQLNQHTRLQVDWEDDEDDDDDDDGDLFILWPLLRSDPVEGAWRPFTRSTFAPAPCQAVLDSLSHPIQFI